MYEPRLNPTRGLMIEKFQPVTRYDLDLARRILDENDELILGVGSAQYSHEPGMIMTAGERIEMLNETLQSEGFDPNRYMIIPIENVPDNNLRWASEVRMLTPRWQRYYTRNFKNSSIFTSLEKMGYTVVAIEEQKPSPFDSRGDFFKNIACCELPYDKTKVADADAVPDEAYETMVMQGIIERVHAIYNRRPVIIDPSKIAKRALFLGGFQPFTGAYGAGTGHIGMVKMGLEDHDEIIIAIGSAQDSHKQDDPLTAGQRIEVIRYALICNNVPSSRFYTIPVKNIDANYPFSAKVCALSPQFDTVLAGNDWTKRLFAESNYEVRHIARTKAHDRPLSATWIRNVAASQLERKPKDSEVSKDDVREIERQLEGMVDMYTLKALEAVGFYDIMHFLSHAKE